jgi:RimJ/RimL family protein N-acetyltransferase
MVRTLVNILQSSTITTLDSYWADFFACPTTSFAQAHILVVPHAGLGDYHGIFFLRRKDALIISVPPADYAMYLSHFAGLTAGAFDDIAALLAQTPAAISQVIGPAWIGYTDTTTLQPHQPSTARLLTNADADAFLRFRATCPARDWEHGGSGFARQSLAGQFIGDALVALVGYERWGEHIAHLAVVTHPDYRGQGYGMRVVRLLAGTVLAQGLIPQYRTLRANTPSMAIAAALGFVAYAESLAIRLA